MKSFCYHPFVIYAVLAVMVEMGYFAVGAGCRLCRLCRLWKRQQRAEGVPGGIWERGDKQGEGEQREKRGEKVKLKGGFQRRYARWVVAAVWIVAVNWVVKNGFLLMGVDLLERLGG